MTTMAKDATLVGVGSHWIADEHGGNAEGISKEEVFPRFRAKWRGQECIVTMHADRYAASFHDESTGTSEKRLTDWRVYASEAREYVDVEGGVNRGDELTGTARAALGDLCEPLVLDWLASKDYAASRRRALGHMILRRFRDEYGAVRDVRERLATVGDQLDPATRKALQRALKAREAYDAARDAVSATLTDPAS